MELIIKETNEVKTLRVARSNFDKDDHRMYDFTNYQSMHTNHFGNSIEVVNDDEGKKLYMSKQNYNAWSKALAVIQEGYNIEAKLVRAGDYNFLKIKKEVANTYNSCANEADTELDKAIKGSLIMRDIHLRLLEGTVANRDATKPSRAINNIKKSDDFVVTSYKRVEHKNPIYSLSGDTPPKVATITVGVELPLAIFTPTSGKKYRKDEILSEVLVYFSVTARGGVHHFATFVKDGALILNEKQEDDIKKAALTVAKRELKNHGMKRVYSTPY